MVISNIHDTHACCWAFISGVVTTRFSDLGLSRPGFELPNLLMWGECSNCATTLVGLYRERPNINYLYFVYIFWQGTTSTSIIKFVHAFICRTRFLVLNYAEKFEETMKKLAELVLSGKIKVNIWKYKIHI